MTNEKLPDGYHFVDTYDENLVAISDQDMGCVTINIKRRAFACGLGGFINPRSTKKYTGRGWKAEIIKDAVEYLRGIHEH